MGESAFRRRIQFEIPNEHDDESQNFCTFSYPEVDHRQSYEALGLVETKYNESLSLLTDEGPVRAMYAKV